MAQTLNFDLKVSQSGIVSGIQQIQSAIANQLQTSTLQLGTMASGLGHTMAAMSNMGIHPSALGFPYAASPGAINYTLGRQPFLGRTHQLSEYMNNSFDAIKQRASAIVSQMDPAQIVPSLQASRSRQTWHAVAQGALSAGASLAGWQGASLLAKGLAIGGIPGFAVTAAGMGVATLLAKPLSKQITKAFGLNKYAQDPEEIKNLTIERKGYADIAAAFMAMAPQKYLPKLGSKIDTKSQIDFGQSIAKAFQAREESSFISRALGHNSAYLTETLNALMHTDPTGAKKYIHPLFKYLGATSEVPAGDVLRNLNRYVESKEISAQAAGYTTLSDRARLNSYSFDMTKDPWFISPYKGPSRDELMGKSVGQKTRLGAKFGGDFFKSFVGRAKKDLGLSTEERKWIGGSRGITYMYGSTAMQDMATFGSTSNIALAALQNTGKLDNYYDMVQGAAETFTDPKKYVDWMLRYKNYTRAAGPKGMDAVFRRSQQMQAEELMRAFPGAFKSRYEAIRFNLKANNGMPHEEATAMAGVIEDIGRTVIFQGKGSGRVALWDQLTGEFKDGLWTGARGEVLRKLKEEMGITDDKTAIEKLKVKQWINPASKSKIMMGGEESEVRYAVLKKYIQDPSSVTDPEQLKDAKMEYEIAQKLGVPFVKGEFESAPLNRYRAAITERLLGLNTRETGFNLRTSGALQTTLALRGVGEDFYAQIVKLGKIYRDATGAEKDEALAKGASLLADTLKKKGIDVYKGAQTILSTKLDENYEMVEELYQKQKNVFIPKADSKGGDYDVISVNQKVLVGLQSAVEGVKELIALEKERRK